ncbi:membrane protein implicated in regulation of membrane protease activity [Lentzea atacamensis]|uniref:Membrane protein implicated in regulation of membrane protease activity n=1 Tax=Lentzea atacamensis TaxID=531938 RepID=A0A316HT51_9PSEU|nr:NfeD family protein [Lentzea atacamensis]PWK83604.1 membrane protein implicated in regulation of membrane protease activity [Lentzea atacamensis]RAS67344.1 membrane protein implicated in regulation of membrane protease activity [Lentzea atacamensis]
MDPWLIWLIIALVLAIAEIFTLTAALGMLAVAAVVTAGTAAIGLPVPGQLVVFSVVSAAGVVLARPWARRMMLQPRLERFGVEALVGASGYVLREVNDHDGLVRIRGEDWTARPYDESLVIPAGRTVDVLHIDGSTAVVYPRE